MTMIPHEEGASGAGSSTEDEIMSASLEQGALGPESVTAGQTAADRLIWLQGLAQSELRKALDRRKHLPPQPVTAAIVNAISAEIRAAIDCHPAGQYSSWVRGTHLGDMQVTVGVPSWPDEPASAPASGAERMTAGEWSGLSPREVVRRTRCEPDQGWGQVQQHIWRRCCDKILERLATPAPATPPGVPDSVRAAVKEAVSKALHDNQFADGWPEMVDPVVDAVLATHPAGQSAGSGADEIVSARLTAWQEGHGGVDIAFASGRRVALALDAPHVGAPTAMLKARNARLGETAGLGDLPNRIYAFLMDGRVRKVSDLYHLMREEEDHKKVWNAVGYLNRRGSIIKLKRGEYQISREFSLDESAPVSTRTGDEGTEDGWRIVRSVMRRLAAAKNAGGVEDPETCAQVLGDAVDAGITMCREALAARPAAPEAQGAWRPIESGPPDGSEVLVFCIDTNEQFVAYQRDGDWHYAYYEPTKTRIVCDPDFWRPLPAPPASSGQGGR